MVSDGNDQWGDGARKGEEMFFSLFNEGDFVGIF